MAENPRELEEIVASYRHALETLGVAAARILGPTEARGFTQRKIDEGDIPEFWKHILKNEAVPV